MARYRGPRLRLVRRLGNLPGLTRKTSKKLHPPGQHGGAKQKVSQYRIRLQEKQKLRYNYGITEKQLLRYVRQAKKQKGSTGENLLQLLEMRLDNTLFRLRMAPTILAARQLVSHGHIQVNNICVTIPSYRCQPKDIVAARPKKRSRQLVESYLEELGNNGVMVPPHISLHKERLLGIVHRNANRQWVGLQINELLVVEYYARKG
uniref:Small ribosomal subunit protein uS4c n=1 Tax=Nephroselmis astigmatica TaxID=259378 RepID=A0A088CIJ8_9CHLO|nr:ribosomal protein S4 [Nephroselmis astigmatica]AID67733.1 ribosomal protein S4 [Nephroselmis astigmatica]